MPMPPEAIGRLGATAVQDTLIEQTIEFVWSCLVPWRDDPDRSFSEGEEELNGALHDFLSARAAEDFPMVFFRHEQRQQGKRRVDLAGKPVHTVIIKGVTYTKYDPILVIEGKRLPAPSKAREREYVSGGIKLTGGIQRFKLGLHGKEHPTVIIVGYLQEGTAKTWHSRVNGWISDLARKLRSSWATCEVMEEFSYLGKKRARTISIHPRVKGCITPKIEILHFWIQLTQRKPVAR